ncbi:hypothetical protein GCM10010193_39940 [Kitasatospora atroaurantiaca]|uniref:recombinase zinc beta ribbon domain-containing protein n=1 Tax=Kitasatospora atroaurantiaca TaxID=285545 RepID=UPI001FEA072F|nr:recombinase zinc beta ribbon domain-containing protein [Kitasatospora atroaurantiaca]
MLANPRYAGRQVWNRQRTDHELINPDNTTLGTRDVMRWNRPEDWAISSHQEHPALVTEADFVAIQHIRAARETAPGRTYQLAGILRCGLCGRRMDSHWAHERPRYRCRHGHTSATADRGRPRNAYLREDRVLAHLPALLLRLAIGSHDPDATPASPGSGQVASASGAVEQLRASALTLTYDPVGRTLTADTEQAERILIG